MRYIYFLFLIVKHLNLCLSISKIKEMIRNIYNNNSEIYLKIKGTGNQQLLSSSFRNEPSEVIVNNVSRNECKKTCNLDKEENNITIKFNMNIKSCNYIFSSSKNITEVDLANFDASEVTDMIHMFNSCENLKKINFGNINTSSLQSMRALFQFCYELTSIDLSSFDTSLVTDMDWMFNGCKNLKYANLGLLNLQIWILLNICFGPVIH